MSLSILSDKSEAQEITFKNVAFASLKARLNFYTLDISLKESESIEIWIKKQFGKSDEDYECFSMDIHNNEWVNNSLNNFFINGKKYFVLAGTDNTPSKLCYEFSLCYLKFKPNHKIAIYENLVFGLEEIEAYDKQFGYNDDWTKYLDRIKQ